MNAEEASRLGAIFADRNRPLKYVRRAQIILASIDWSPIPEVAQQSGASRTAIWRRQGRYALAGEDGLLRDKTRQPGKTLLSTTTVARVLAPTRSEQPGEATHWPGWAMAKAIGVALSAIYQIWVADHLQPHRYEIFKRSTDPAFAKVGEVVGRYMHLPAHALVLHIKDKTYIQALDRTQSGLSLMRGGCGTITQDYKRPGKTTLLAAAQHPGWGVDWALHARSHRHPRVYRLPQRHSARHSPGKPAHAVPDNYDTHEHPKVRAWPERHPRCVFHFTPTPASWPNAVEGCSSVRTRRRLRRGVFKAVVDLRAAGTRSLKDHNVDLQSFVWTKPLVAIFDKLARGPAPTV